MLPKQTAMMHLYVWLTPTNLNLTMKITNGQIIINVKERIGRNIGIQFEYNSERGLYNITRDAIKNDELVTILFAEGSTKNLPASYGHLRLQMPVDELVSNVTIYGPIEKTEVFEDIYPERNSTLTGYQEVLDETEQEVEQYIASDTSLINEGLNIKDCLIPNTSPKIFFNSGDLAGFSF